MVYVSGAGSGGGGVVIDEKSSLIQIVIWHQKVFFVSNTCL